MKTHRAGLVLALLVLLVAVLVSRLGSTGPSKGPSATAPNIKSGVTSPGLAADIETGASRPTPVTGGGITDQPNVIFITIDALNASHVGSYGNPQVKTPTIDRLASGGARFSSQINAFSQTNPSLAAIFTSNYPATHKVMAQGLDRLQGNLPTLAGLLADHGYYTAAIYASKALDPETSGLDQGFITYEPVYIPNPVQVDAFRLFDGRADITTDGALSWLARTPQIPFFLWVHYQDPHYPYTPPPPFNSMYDQCDECAGGGFDTIDRIGAGEYLSEQDIKHVRALYDGEISFADQELGRLLEQMERAGYLDNAMVVLTADEGQSLNDHGLWFHPTILYNTVIRAPLIINYPGSIPQGIQVDAVTRGIDIMPTVLEALGIPIPNEAEGHSLWPLITGEEKGDVRVAFAQGFENQKLAVVAGGWKLIRDNRTGYLELYYLKSDPDETQDLATVNPGKAAELEEMAREWMDSHDVPYGDVSRVSIDTSE